jgi:hypothetical protein
MLYVTYYGRTYLVESEADIMPLILLLLALDQRAA